MKLFILSKIVTILFWLTMMTCRVKMRGNENIELLKKEGKNWVYSLWHNNILICTWLLRKNHPFGLVSLSKEGEAIAKVMQTFGWRLIRGSSSKKGMSALISMIKQVKKGELAAITPDGPRGPRYQLQSGAIMLAQKSGAPLIPCHVECSRQWVFTKSWDQHKFPKPFSTIYLSFGKPFYVPEKLEKEHLEKTSEQFENEMNQNVEKTLLFKQGKE